MKNIMDFMKPTIITAQQYGTKISVELDHSDTDIDELFDAFETICIGLGYHSDGWKQWILDRADEYRDEEFDKNYSFDFPESQIDDAFAEHNRDEELVWGSEEETGWEPEHGINSPKYFKDSEGFEDYKEFEDNDGGFQAPPPSKTLIDAKKQYDEQVKSISKKRKGKTVQQWEDEIDLGGNE